MGNPNYEDVFVLAYTNNYLQVPQERRNVFDGHIMMSPLEGEQMGFDDIGTGSMTKKTTKFAEVNYSDNEFRRRWLFPEFYYDAKLVDKQDNIAQHTDPASTYMTSMVYAIEREKITIVLNAFDAAVTGGKNPGDTSFTFTNTAISNAAGRTIVVDTKNDGTAGGTVTGLTVNKLILLREKFATLGNPDGMPINLVTSFKQKSDLLREAEIQNWDTSEVKALVDGRIDSYMGVKFIQTNQVVEGSANGVGGQDVYECFAWLPEGITMANHLSPKFSVDRLPTKVGDTWQIKADFGANAIRRNEDMVLKVEC
jgi:hypothetical protein